MNRDLRRSALLAVLLAAAALSLAIAGHPPGPPSPESGIAPPAPIPASTFAEREALRTLLLDSVTRAGEVLDTLQPGVHDQTVGAALAAVEECADDDLSRLLATGIDYSILDEATKAMTEMLDDPRLQIDPNAVYDDPGDSPGFPDPEYSFIGDDGFHWGAEVAAFTLANVADAAEFIANLGCQQTIPIPIVGGSIDGSVICIATAVIKYAAGAFAETVSFTNDDIGSWKTQAALDRTCHLHNDLLALQGAMDAMDAKATALLVKLDDLALTTETLRETSCEHIRLVLLPQEQRTSDLPHCPE
jgi:hypothetical protein